MIFEETPQEVQRVATIKLMCLLSHLECAIDLAEELDFHPDVKRLRETKTSERFKRAAGIALKDILYNFKSPGLTDHNGTLITSNDDIQIEVFGIIKKMKELNMEAMVNTIEDVNEA
mgnify:CR=1 FL=1